MFRTKFKKIQIEISGLVKGWLVNMLRTDDLEARMDWVEEDITELQKQIRELKTTKTKGK